jgi:DNA-binding transcriptional ArsR family regulator
MRDQSPFAEGPAWPARPSLRVEPAFQIRLLLQSGRRDLTVPIDITDPRVVKAYAHPLRAHILGLLDNRVASPREIATELDTPLSNTAYHVRQLASLGLVELVGRSVKRGAIEHHYTAKVRPTITDEGWAKLPEIVKRASISGSLQHGVAQMVAAVEEGGFDRDDIHYSRTAGKLDEKAWKAISRELSRTLERVERLVEESAARLADDPDLEAEDATVILMHFSGPAPTRVPNRQPSRTKKLALQTDALAARVAQNQT